jgi:hypothetical protein
MHRPLEVSTYQLSYNHSYCKIPLAHQIFPAKLHSNIQLINYFFSSQNSSEQFCKFVLKLKDLRFTQW